MSAALLRTYLPVGQFVPPAQVACRAQPQHFHAESLGLFGRMASGPLVAQSECCLVGLQQRELLLWLDAGCLPHRPALPAATHHTARLCIVCLTVLVQHCIFAGF